MSAHPEVTIPTTIISQKPRWFQTPWKDTSEPITDPKLIEFVKQYTTSSVPFTLNFVKNMGAKLLGYAIETANLEIGLKLLELNIDPNLQATLGDNDPRAGTPALYRLCSMVYEEKVAIEFQLTFIDTLLNNKHCPARADLKIKGTCLEFVIEKILENYNRSAQGKLYPGLEILKKILATNRFYGIDKFGTQTARPDILKLIFTIVNKQNSALQHVESMGLALGDFRALAKVRMELIRNLVQLVLNFTNRCYPYQGENYPHGVSLNGYVFDLAVDFNDDMILEMISQDIVKQQIKPMLKRVTEERLMPKELMDILKDYRKTFSNNTERSKGALDKLISNLYNEIMASWQGGYEFYDHIQNATARFAQQILMGDAYPNMLKRTSKSKLRGKWIVGDDFVELSVLAINCIINSYLEMDDPESKVIQETVFCEHAHTFFESSRTTHEALLFLSGVNHRKRELQIEAELAPFFALIENDPSFKTLSKWFDDKEEHAIRIIFNKIKTQEMRCYKDFVGGRCYTVEHYRKPKIAQQISHSYEEEFVVLGKMREYQLTIDTTKGISIKAISNKHLNNKSVTLYISKEGTLRCVDSDSTLANELRNIKKEQSSTAPQEMSVERWCELQTQSIQSGDKVGRTLKS